MTFYSALRRIAVSWTVVYTTFPAINIKTPILWIDIVRKGQKMDAVPSKGRDPLLNGTTNARMENISVPSDLFYRKLYTDLLYLFNNGDLVRNLSFLSRDGGEEISRNGNLPRYFAQGVSKVTRRIRGRIVFALAIIQGLKIRGEVGRLGRRLHCKMRVKKKRTISLTRAACFSCWINFKIMRK